MTKGELIEALAPFDDEIELFVRGHGSYRFISDGFYGMEKDGTGVFILSAVKQAVMSVRAITRAARSGT